MGQQGCYGTWLCVGFEPRESELKRRCPGTGGENRCLGWSMCEKQQRDTRHMGQSQMA